MHIKILENKRRQHSVVIMHKRKIRDEVKPHLKLKKQEWKAATVGHKIRIRNEWVRKVSAARAPLREQKRKHRSIIRQQQMRNLGYDV
jgi:hypothetical protein